MFYLLFITAVSLFAYLLFRQHRRDVRKFKAFTLHSEASMREWRNMNRNKRTFVQIFRAAKERNKL